MSISSSDLPNAMERVRQAAKTDKKMQFTTLWHHVYNIESLREAYFSLKRNAAPGIDGETWRHYGEGLDENLRHLADELKRGAYKAKPVRRSYIPKSKGGKRPLGVPSLEDKIVQRAAAEVLNAIYETAFIGFSYGFRPGRNPHHALNALYAGIMTRKVNWVFEADICGYFDAIDHKWMQEFMEHKIADKRVLRHINKWLNAGVLEDGVRKQSEEGVPQGGSISPILANVYMHYVFDLWADQWRRKHSHGDMIIVRYCDDFVVGFQYKDDAEQFWRELIERFGEFNLKLHEDKTRLIEFGRFAAENRKRNGEKKPETFDFLGFTHICGKTRKGYFIIFLHTISKRVSSKLRELKVELKRRLHDPVQEVGRWLRTVLLGYYRYYGLPGNSRKIESFWYYLEIGRASCREKCRSRWSPYH